MHPEPAFSSRRRLLLQGALAASLVPAVAQAAASWPQKPLRLIVGFPPGSSPDMLARVVADPLAEALGQPVIVENKVGAAGSIGVAAVARATDGYTIGLTGNGPLTTAKALTPSTPYDVARDLRPISLVASSPFVLAGSTAMPATDLRGFLDFAKARGDKLSYGSIGPGSGSHLTMELLKTHTGIRAVHVPFQGFPQIATALMGRQIDLSFMIPSIAVPQAKNGRLRLYGVSTATAFPGPGGVPPIESALGKQGFDVASWNAIFGPASMPAPVADRLSQEIARIFQTPQVKQRLLDQGWLAIGSAPDALAHKIAEDTAMWGGVIKLTGARSE
ncbi:tripartite tricarboxylate transporter substrate binding protein [Variovorax sp. J31P207]|uniref:Bug family tripartite tricarboxylate transporter substrate binding protein n=1 Tax=Variovorax sp. J31P207 TaxID=3053510 RepID=UPI00257890A7|nr:tripartite tricarboxylate transporter substrate binding protein [Variovorax sp. J31P207]MDM0070598.1 tripartite tricarboxylate transporter substrate binding protein [Variovorax sp. J31P207]